MNFIIEVLNGRRCFQHYYFLDQTYSLEGSLGVRVTSSGVALGTVIPGLSRMSTNVSETVPNSNA